MRDSYIRKIEGGERQIMIEVAPGEAIQETIALKLGLIRESTAPRVDPLAKVRLDEWVD